MAEHGDRWKKIRARFRTNAKAPSRQPRSEFNFAVRKKVAVITVSTMTLSVTGKLNLSRGGIFIVRYRYELNGRREEEKLFFNLIQRSRICATSIKSCYALVN